MLPLHLSIACHSSLNGKRRDEWSINICLFVFNFLSHWSFSFSFPVLAVLWSRLQLLLDQFHTNSTHVSTVYPLRRPKGLNIAPEDLRLLIR